MMTEMRARVLVGMAVVICSLAGVGCGAARSPRSPSTRTSTASRAETDGTTSAVSSAPDKLLLAAARALREAHGYAMRGAITDGRQGIRFTASASPRGSVAIGVAIGRSSAQLRFVKRAAYLQANEYYWRSQPATRSRAPALANRWLAVPTARAAALASSFGILSPPTFTRCLVENHGSLSIIAGSRVAGKPTLVLKDDGNAPGAAPSSLLIAAQGPPYPLRLSSNGNTRC
jgi:hypothetical protein